MNIIWLGHASFRLEIGGQVLLIDPWLEGNPMLDESQYEAALAGATHVLVTHGHSDHAASVPQICKTYDIPCVGIYDLMQWWAEKYDLTTMGFNKGGTVDLGGVKVTMVNAAHSSAQQSANGPIYMGHEAGYMIEAEGHVIYVSGDTDIMADMEWMGEVHAPDIGILCAGGHFTMDMARASYAARKYFNFKTVIPCHYRTFPLLEQNADLMKQVLTDVDVIEPDVMQAIVI
ncbi:MAG: metal-dependent hydrolase [Maritimibacter sp.]